LIFTPSLEIVLIVRQVVIAIILTPVRYKRYAQFLTSAPFLGGQLAPLTRLSRAPEILMKAFYAAAF